MAHDREVHHRSSARLKTFDYTSNATYFVTVCANVRTNVFGEIVDAAMQLNDAGKMILEEWNRARGHPDLAYFSGLLFLFLIRCDSATAPLLGVAHE